MTTSHDNPVQAMISGALFWQPFCSYAAAESRRNALNEQRQKQERARAQARELVALRRRFGCGHGQKFIEP